MQFLGMQKKKKTAEEERNDPIKLMDRQRAERKSVQEGNWKSYLNAKANIKDEIEANEGTDIMEGMLKDRRDWINEYRQNHMGKIPDEIKPFYDRFNVEAPLSPEEEEAKRLADEEEKGKKKKKEKKKEKKKKKKRETKMTLALRSLKLAPLKWFKSSMSSMKTTVKPG